MNKKEYAPLPDDISKRIISLRFLLIVFVIFIHNNFTKSNAITYNMTFNQPEWIHWIKIFISESLCQCAVSLFFFFAAYLRTYNKKTYLKLIKSRIKTLYVPYIIWTLITVLFYFIAQKNFFLQKYFNKTENLVLAFTIQDWIGGFTGLGRENYWPLVFQFWFLRDLIVLELLSPIIDFLMKYIPLIIIITISTLFCLDVNISVISAVSLFSYGIGCFCGENRYNFFEFSDKFSLVQLLVEFILFVVVKYFTANIVCNIQILNICIIIFAAMLMLKSSHYFVLHEKYYSILSKLSVFSFFLYAFHAPLVEISLNKLTYNFFFSIPIFGYLLQYFFSPIVTILLGLLIGKSLKKFIPMLFALLNGKR